MMTDFTFRFHSPHHRRFIICLYGKEIGRQHLHIGIRGRRAELFTFSWRLK
jgi:hypothetical protein